MKIVFPFEGETYDNKWRTFIESCMSCNTLDFYTYDNPSFMYVVISVSIMWATRHVNMCRQTRQTMQLSSNILWHSRLNKKYFKGVHIHYVI